MIHKIAKAFLILSSLFTISSYAILDLQLTQGIKSAIPIAVVPFSGQSNTQSTDNVSSVISADLKNSGRFNVMGINLMGEMPHSAKEVDFTYWQKQHQNVSPILLLDEVAAHLDPQKRERFFSHLIKLQSQFWLSGTEMEPFSSLKGQAQFFDVEKGLVKSRNM